MAVPESPAMPTRHNSRVDTVGSTIPRVPREDDRCGRAAVVPDRFSSDDVFDADLVVAVEQRERHRQAEALGRVPSDDRI